MDATAPSDIFPGKSLRRVDVRFTSQAVDGVRMDRTAAIFPPADLPCDSFAGCP